MLDHVYYINTQFEGFNRVVTQSLIAFLFGLAFRLRGRQKGMALALMVPTVWHSVLLSGILHIGNFITALGADVMSIVAILFITNKRGVTIFGWRLVKICLVSVAINVVGWGALSGGPDSAWYIVAYMPLAAAYIALYAYTITVFNKGDSQRCALKPKLTR